MSNMSYCRFENTLEDLRDCWEHWDDLDGDSSEDEIHAQAIMLKLCRRIVDNYEED